MSTTLKYPYRWGVDVVQSFLEKYPRGANFLGRLCSVDHQQVKHWLVMGLCRGNSIRYESLKRVIKLLDGSEWEEFARFSEKERKVLIRWIVIVAEEEVFDQKEEAIALDNLRQRRLL